MFDGLRFSILHAHPDRQTQSKKRATQKITITEKWIKRNEDFARKYEKP